MLVIKKDMEGLVSYAPPCHEHSEPAKVKGDLL